MHYDHNRQLLKVIHPGGSKLTWTRDNFGNVLTYTDLGSAETRNILDGLKRVVEQIASGCNHGQYVKIVKTTQIIVFISQVTAHTFALDAYKQAFVNLNGSAHTGNTSH